MDHLDLKRSRGLNKSNPKKLSFKKLKNKGRKSKDSKTINNLMRVMSSRINNNNQTIASLTLRN